MRFGGSQRLDSTQRAKNVTNVIRGRVIKIRFFFFYVFAAAFAHPSRARVSRLSRFTCPPRPHEFTERFLPSLFLDAPLFHAFRDAGHDLPARLVRVFAVDFEPSPGDEGRDGAFQLAT